MKNLGPKILEEIEKNGLMLLQDKLFPNIINSIIGKSISGSWWSHPQGNHIYNGINWAMDQNQVICVKFLSGKNTYIHKKLWPYFFSIVNKARDWQTDKLTDDELKLYSIISKKSLRSDNPLAKLNKNILLKLEKKILFESNEVHSETGKHYKLYKKWDAKITNNTQLPDYQTSIDFFDNLISNYNSKAGSKLKLPWK